MSRIMSGISASDRDRMVDTGHKRRLSLERLALRELAMQGTIVATMELRGTALERVNGF